LKNVKTEKRKNVN